MKKNFKEITFANKEKESFQFDLVSFQDLLKKKPSDHSQFEFHKLSFFAIFIITEKEGKYNLNFNDYEYKKGTLFTVRKDNIHKFYQSKAKGKLLVFTENFIVNHSNKLEASKLFMLFNEMLASPKLELNNMEFKEVLALIELIKEENVGVNDRYSPSIVRNFVQILITKLFRIKSKNHLVFDDNKYLTKFLELQKLVEADCFNNKKVSYYANIMGVTSKTLNNITQSIIHRTAKSFINEIVIIQCKRLIINSQDSLTEIAYQVGFNESTNFFKYFTKYTGVSPSQFRTTYQTV